MEELIIGFFIGMLVGGWWVTYFIKMMKKNGYAKFDVTQKFMNKIK